MKKRVGIALVMVLTTAGLLLMLLGAFVKLNQDHFSLVQNDQHHEAAVEAANSALDYCSYRLEHNRLWGKATFLTDTVDSEVASSLIVRELQNSHALEGQVVGTEAQFHVEILNNIEGSGLVDGVPKGSCRFSITARRGSSAISREAILTTAPLFDASAISSKRVRFTSRSLEVGSTDPVRNRIRSKGPIEVLLPKLEKLSFSPAPKATEKGLLWAAQGIHLYDVVVGPFPDYLTNILKDYNMEDPKALAQATATTSGAFLAKAQTHYEIHDLQFSEIKVSSEKQVVDGGVYVFTDAKVALDDGGTRTVKMLQRRESSVVEGHLTAGVVLDFWYVGNDVPDDKITALVGSGATPHRVTEASFAIQPGVKANVDNRTVRIKPDVDVTVSGDFGVSSDQPDKVARLFFEQDKLKPASQPSVSAQGQIFIDGIVIGSGKLLAQGDVTLRPISVDLEGDTESDLCIFSGASVRIKPPDDGEEVKKTRYRGLIYARKDLLYYAKGADVDVEGALVAKNGEVHISQAGKVKLTYNPDYLDSILKKMPEARVRLEVGLWKEL